MRGFAKSALAAMCLSVGFVVVSPAPSAFAAPTPAVALSSDQLNPLIGEQVAFAVAFDNTGSGSADTGYGPYVDLRLNAGGADGNDGVTFTSATYLGAPITPLATFTCTGVAQIHPLTGQSLTCPTGTQIVVIQLPFGSFTAGQPIATIAVTAAVSNLADVGTGLVVTATPGFAYGNSATGSTPIVGAQQTLTLVPQVVRFTKTYVGPELETATGPNYPRRFRLSVDIANGQRVSDLTITDRLPIEHAFLSVTSTSGSPTAVATPATAVPSSAPNNRLIRLFPGVTTGTAATEDAFVEFEYFIPRLDAVAAAVIDPSTGDDKLTHNDGLASGTVVPLDTRDASQAFVIDPNVITAPYPDNVDMTAKSIAVQKSVEIVTDVGETGATPGDTLQYTISGQVSDYFTFAAVVVDDTLGDGQTFDGSYTPTLSLTESGTPTAASLTTHFTVNSAARTTCGNGTTAIQFGVSDAYAAVGGLGGGGILTGGRVAVDTGPATFTITFRAVIDDAYTCAPTASNKLDPRDFVTNDVAVTGEVYDNTTQLPQSTPMFESDGSGTSVDVKPTTLQKSIWARNGVVGGFTGSPAQFAANDTITYRIKMHLPSSDISGMSIGDYLPLPVLTATSLVQGANCTVSTAPALGQWCYGPTDTFHAVVGAPSVAADSAANSITWTYGTQEITDNLPRDVELFFTLQISNAPFREGLFLTNQAQAFEANSFGSPFTTPAIVQIELTEPLLNIDKGVVARSAHPGSLLTGTVAPTGVTFSGVGTAACPSFSPTINSTNRNNAPAADVTGLDAHDIVRFAIVVENTGKGINGAFDVAVSDSIPAGFQIPAGGLDLCVTSGSRASIPFTATGFFTGTPTTSPLGTGTIQLTDGVTSGALGPYSASSGDNLAVITYDLELIPTIGANTPADSLTNTATITGYAATEGGPSFNPITPVADLTQTATVATVPVAIGKQLIATNQATTTGTNVAIGEEVEYTVTVTFPEGLSRGVSVVDTLPAGLAISQAPGSASVGSALTASASAPVVSNGGHTLTYTIGDVTNANTDNTTTTNETITFTYWAVVLDVIGNQNATTLNNSAAVSYTRGNTGAATSTHTAGTPVTVTEPNLNVAKSVSPATADAGDELTYTIVVNHNSQSANAHEVTFSDTIPTGLTYVNASLASSGATAPTTLSISGALITASWTSFPVGSSTTITFRATVDSSFNAVTAITNTAGIAWTSLPGSPTATLYDANGIERTGAGGVNDYIDTAAAIMQPVAPTIVKALVDTDQATTTSPNVTIGEVVTYDMRVSLPDGNISGFTVTDQIPAGLQYVPSSMQIFTLAAGGETPSAGIAQNFGGTLGTAVASGGVGDGGDLTVTFASTTNPSDLNANNNSFVVRLQARVLNVPGNVGVSPGQVTLRNRGVVQLNGSTAVNSGFVGTPVVEPRMVVTKTFTPTTASQGDTVTVNVRVQNTGLGAAHDVVINDVLDSHFDETSAAAVSTPTGFAYSRSVSTITYTADPGTSVLPGATVDFSFTVALDAVVPIGTAIPNRATVTQATTIPGVNAGERDEPDTFSDAVLNSVGPDLQLTKSDGATTSTPGSQTTYNLVVTNVGGFQATGVFIDDTLPPATTFVAVGGPSCSDGGVQGAARRIAITGPIAANGGTVTCTITIAMTSPAPAGTAGYLNTATVTDDGINGPDPTPGNNAASDENTITGRAPDLVIIKTDGVGTLSPGQSTTYTITIANAGNIGVTNVSVLDTLPPGLTFVSCTSVSGTVNVACTHGGGIVTIGYASIAGGGSASFTVTATADNPMAAAIDTVVNGVTVTNDGANGSDVNSANNSASDTDTIEAAPNMSVVKTHTEPNVAPGGTVTYQLNVANIGNQDATGVVVTDTVDPQMNIGCGTVVPTPTTCNTGTGVITWGPGLTDTGTIAVGGIFRAGQAETLTYAVTADNPLLAGMVRFDNSVSVADDGRNGADATPADNVDTDAVPLVGNAPELGITKTDSVASVVPGATPTYTLVITNSGTIGASSVTVSDTLPPGLEFVSCTVGCNSSGLPVVTWNLGTVAGGGGQRTVTVSVRVANPAVAGLSSIPNSASVSDDGVNGVDPVPGNNIASDTDTLTAAPDLVVTKDDGATSRTAGEQFDYTITVRNVGNQAATGVIVVDTLPSQLTAMSCPAGPVACTIDSSLATVTWNVGNLNGGAALPTPAANSAITLTVRVQVDATLPSGIAAFTNLVRAADDGSNGADVTPGDNSASDLDTLVATPDLQLTKSDGVSTAVPGDTLTYSIVVTNAGSQAATGVSVSDTLPAGVTFVSCSPTCNSSGLPILVWSGLTEDVAGSPPDSAAFDALGQATLTVVVTVDSPAAAGIDGLDNVAVVTDDGQNGLDPTPGNNAAHDVDVLDAAPDLAVAKSDGVLSVIGGQTVTYTVQFRNKGSQDATGVVVTDVLPTGVTFVSCTGECVSTAAPTIVWTVGALAAGQSGTEQVTVHVDDPVDPLMRHFVNNVSIADDGANGVDPNPADNTSSDDDTTGIDLAVTKTDGVTSAVPGASLTYTVTVANNGPTTIQTLELQDMLPEALAQVVYTPSVGVYDASSHVWSGFGDFAEGDTVTMTIAGSLNAAATGTLTNTVEVRPPASVPDSNLANNTAHDIDTLTPMATLVIDKQLTTTLVRGSTASYTISVRNDGPSVARDVTITDALPSSLTYTAAAAAGWTCPPAAQGAGGDVVCDLDVPLEVNQTRNLELTVIVSGDFGSTVLNHASVASSGALSDASVLNDAAVASIAPAPLPLPLPRTGSSPLPTLLASAVFVGSGVLIMALRRRRIRPISLAERPRRRRI